MTDIITAIGMCAFLAYYGYHINSFLDALINGNQKQGARQSCKPQ